MDVETEGRAVTAPAWMPSTAEGAAVLPAGVHWDAARVPLGLGMDLVAAMERPQPVIRNQANVTVAWLIPKGAAGDWPDLRHVDVLRAARAARRLTVPAATEVWERWDGGPATSWRIAPRPGPLADPDVLLDALSRVLSRTVR
ncbi:hypothetical protein FH609_004055 [Streptomyces sp. 3MP-14]|uniref:Uncharacterized protein n=1 Tax=Streptomyces mimosae TaxID=2586635 RepID=A0A5N6A654_9ACTN|nr:MULTISPECIES: hypothetical protein [Streptomyces]KAB8162908.1 hypothetical protein FH607_019920 [Streptomyces mimosae]KAB8179121.1 hypothetical protein FH609_004055 [Streptomyces sp. 3MP-14]